MIGSRLLMCLRPPAPLRAAPYLLLAMAALSPAFAPAALAQDLDTAVAYTLLDADSRAPIEGALVYSPGARRAYRSDVHGRLLVPTPIAREGLEIHAGGYRTQRIAPGAAGDILLTFDPALLTPAEAELTFTRADTLRGTYGRYRANNDVLTYDLELDVDVERGFISGTNRITFRMLEEDDRIQLDLFDNMNVDAIRLGDRELGWTREFNAVFVEFADPLRRGETYAIDFHYSGHPRTTGRFGGMVFATDSLGSPWVYTANQGIGASLWWPNKDQQPDEVDSMSIRLTVPAGLVAVSNGRLMARQELDDGRTRFDWKVHYPINNYSVSLNIADYRHFADTLGELTLDFFTLPYHLEAARRQFAQAKPMLECFERHFGAYPFPRDGYKLIEVPYSGMEHQSAITYGNQFRNGYLGRDWTGVGVSPKFDFIIVHESGHEWFGNSVTANDFSEAWIHEGWGTYAEAVYVECMFGIDDANLYMRGYRDKVQNQQPIIGPPGVNYWPPNDQYFKGALFLHTLRYAVADDELWWSLVRGFAEHFRHANIWTVDVINFFNERLERAAGADAPLDVRPIFQQYLYHAALPVLELRFENDSVFHRWRADVDDFAMPMTVRTPTGTRSIRPTAAWTAEPLHGTAPDAWLPATDLFYVEVRRD